MPSRRKDPLVINIVGRNVPITDALREYVENKFGHLERYLDRLSEINVVLVSENAQRAEERNTAECVATVKGKPLRADCSDATMYAAIDGLVDKMHHQLVRFKEKTRSHKRGGATTPDVESLGNDQELEAEPETAGGDARIVRLKQFVLKPSFPDEAIDELEDLDHDFYVFLNAETEQISVLYRRREGNYGLIEPAFD